MPTSIPLRDLPAFAEIMKPGHLDRSYAAVWTGDFQFEASPIFGLDPTAHLQRCRELGSQGLPHCRPLGRPDLSRGTADHRLSLASPGDHGRDQGPTGGTSSSGSGRSASDGESRRDHPLLRHSADPRLRSFIVNWLSPLGADPSTITAELERLPANAQPTPAQGKQLMDAILFHPETSQRRALILALGTYGTEGLSSGEREPLIGKLLDLYRNDPDAASTERRNGHCGNGSSRRRFKPN